MKRRSLFFFTLLIILLWSTSAIALEVRITGDHLSLHANQEPLQDILKRMAELGIRIRIDPQLNPEISASFEDRDIQRGLQSILKSLNYALIWNSIKGPAGPIPKLAEIQIFRPGKKDLMRRLGKRGNLSIGRDPRDGSLFVSHEILLGFKPGMSLAEFKRLLRQIGGTVLESNPAIGIYKIRLPENSDVPSVVEQITNHPKIAKAEPNYAYPISMPHRDTATTESTFTAPKVVAPAGQAPIAVLDSGLAQGSGAQELVLTSLDALNPDEPISDTLGHGTQMALIAAGIVKPYGVSTGSETSNPIIPIRVFDDNGFTSNFDIMSSINFALNNGARVMSLSWGSETRSEFLESALDYAGSKGLVVVASAGNEPTGRPVFPAAYPSVIGVGALGPDNKPWEKSNYGDFVALYAPGYARLPVGYKGDPGLYAGTSISAAFVANLIANYLSQNPSATMQELSNALRKE